MTGSKIRTHVTRSSLERLVSSRFAKAHTASSTLLMMLSALWRLSSWVTAVRSIAVHPNPAFERTPIGAASTTERLDSAAEGYGQSTQVNTSRMGSCPWTQTAGGSSRIFNG